MLERTAAHLLRRFTQLSHRHSGGLEALQPDVHKHGNRNPEAAAGPRKPAEFVRH